MNMQLKSVSINIGVIIKMMADLPDKQINECLNDTNDC